MKRFIIFIAVFSISAASTAQILKPVKWSYASKRVSVTEAVVLIKATMEKGWHIYSQTVTESGPRSEENTSELQSLMRISYAVLCCKQKNNNHSYYSYNI